LDGKRRFQDALENLFMAKLQRFLDSRVGIKSGKSGVFIAATGEIPQGSQVSQPGK